MQQFKYLNNLRYISSFSKHMSRVITFAKISICRHEFPLRVNKYELDDGLQNVPVPVSDSLAL